MSVVRLSASFDRADVYDLTVDGAHEFVAAGVIVHNCVFALTELMVDQPGGRQYESHEGMSEPVRRRGDLVQRGARYIDK